MQIALHRELLPIFPSGTSIRVSEVDKTILEHQSKICKGCLPLRYDNNPL